MASAGTRTNTYNALVTVFVAVGSMVSNHHGLLCIEV